jgi:uncharacterized protein YecT (DUF1311 family)
LLSNLNSGKPVTEGNFTDRNMGRSTFMQRLFRSLMFTAVASSLALAQSTEVLNGCMDKAGTQTAMNVCADEEAIRVDAELRGMYQKVLSAAGEHSDAAERIRTAERAWIVYREAYLNAMYPAANKLAEYGSSFPMEANLVRAKLTRQQISAVADLLKQYRPRTQ